MPANTAPIYTNVPDVSWAGSITTANTAKDGTGTVATGFTAGTNGSYVQRVIARPLGTNVASVLRVFVNNGSTNATAGNNSLIAEVSLPATTLSEVAALVPIELPVNLPLPGGYKLNFTIGTTVSAGWQITCVGGDY